MELFQKREFNIAKEQLTGKKKDAHIVHQTHCLNLYFTSRGLKETNKNKKKQMAEVLAFCENISGNKLIFSNWNI